MSSGRKSINGVALRIALAGLVLAGFAALLVDAPYRASAVPVIPTGNVMVSVSNGQVDEFTPAGTLVQTLTTGDGGFTTGSVFDSTGNFYVTDFTANAITKFDPTGTLIGDVASGGSLSADESILFDTAGNAYVGNSGSNQLLKFPPGFGSNSAFTLTTENRGTDWDDLASDDCTMRYTSEAADILTFNVCTSTQGANFNAAALPGGISYALRILPKAVGSVPAGSILVADTSEVTVLDNTGAQIRHDVFGSGGLFALNLDPDGTSYWTGDFNSAQVFRNDIATGANITNWNTGTGGNTVFGISVKGEIKAVPTATPTVTPTPTATPTPVPPPVCSAAVASAPTLWPPDHKFVSETITGVTTSDGPVTINITSIFQDEPTLDPKSIGAGDTCPDGSGVGTSTAQVRAERAGNVNVPGDGRVYHIAFTATDTLGHSCNGTVLVCVPHDQGKGINCVDEGPLFDSTKCP